ncbi:MAG: transcription initiation protein, partial [Chloroflexi bacterium]|nr:transcription initiation protein [Chloroflexota bacterium]
MTKYLISFPGSAMNHIPPEDFPAVSEASHEVVREAKRAGVWIFGGGINEDVPSIMVAGDCT